MPSAALQVLDVAIKHSLASRSDCIASTQGFFFERFPGAAVQGKPNYEACPCRSSAELVTSVAQVPESAYRRRRSVL